jgi:methionine synthase II (cobalamin-independent)
MAPVRSQVFPALAQSSIQQVSLECIHSHVPPELMQLLEGKDVMVGVIDVASEVVETPEEVADTIARALEFVPKAAPVPLHQLRPGPNEPRSGPSPAAGRLPPRRPDRW